jgi:hypothetical protein
VSEGILDFALFEATCICMQRLKLGGGWLCHLLCPTLDMGVSAFVVSLQGVACPASVLCVFAISFCFVHAYEEFGSPGSSRSLAMSQSFVVLGCQAWNALPHGMNI